VIDVRSPDEWDAGHLPNATLIAGFNSAGFDAPGADVLAGCAQCNVLAYCRSGVRSKEAAGILEAAGYTSVFDGQGINQWTGAGYSLVFTASAMPPCHSSACGAAAPLLLEIDFDEPRQGPVCQRALVGDQLKFTWIEQHNLYSLPDRSSYDSCDFGTATQLAPAGSRPDGLLVAVDEKAQYYACSKICASNGHKVRICVDEALCDDSCRVREDTELALLPPPPPAGAGALGTGALVGIVCGSIGGAVLLGGLVYVFCLRPRARTSATSSSTK